MIPIGNIGGAVVKVLDGWNQRGLRKLAWCLRDYADGEKRKEPKLYCISRTALARQLGRSANRIREVLEFMEARGWAVKVRNLVDSWQIN